MSGAEPRSLFIVLYMSGAEPRSLFSNSNMNNVMDYSMTT
jgi:hypothetical protein